MAQTPEKVEVVMEVDTESLKPYFDNIAQGFTDLSQYIRKLQLGQAALAVALVVTNVVHFIV